MIGMRLLFIVAIIFCALLSVVYGDDSNIEKKGIFSRNHRPRDVRRRNKQLLPPMVLPGIMNDYDPARVYHRGKRMFISELKSLENRFPYMEEALNGRQNFVSFLNSVGRNKRSLMEGEQMMHDKVPPPIIPQRKRDLRRLKRDLAYATGHNYPNYEMSNRNHDHVPYTDYVPSEEDIESLLQGVDMLEYLTLLKQAGELPSIRVPEKYHNFHSSRFAPQPRLFPAEAFKKDDNGRLRGNKHHAEGRMIWSPEKRASVGSLSMVPGFKRSAFREAERMSPYISHTNSISHLPDEVFANEYKNMKIRRVAM